jgi:hypothetical protein
MRKHGHDMGKRRPRVWSCAAICLINTSILTRMITRSAWWRSTTSPCLVLCYPYLTNQFYPHQDDYKISMVTKNDVPEFGRVLPISYKSILSSPGWFQDQHGDEARRARVWSCATHYKKFHPHQDDYKISMLTKHDVPEFGPVLPIPYKTIVSLLGRLQD